MPCAATGRDGVFVDRVFAGGFHCMILDSTAMPWSWGWNVRGQLGRTVRIQAQPYRLVSLKYVRVKTAALGHVHTLLLTDAQQVFVFGDNTYGQLGTGERGEASSLSMPVRLPIGGQAVLQVAHLRALPFRKDLDKEAAREWALGESRARAERDVDAFAAQLFQNGWLAGKVLLSSAERAPYRVAGEVVRELAPTPGTGTKAEGEEE